MEFLNYHHLLYFWTVAREGSVAAACQRLHLAQPTISAQIHALERALGHKLLMRVGRGLSLTDMGRRVYRYADEIFSVGRELMDMVRDRPVGRPERLCVGIADALPKLVVHRLLAPALNLPEPVQLVCTEGKPPELLARLAVHELDLVLSDAPVPPTASVRAFNHLLGQCPVSIFAIPQAAARYREGFPKSLEGAPFLLPAANTMLRRSLDQWFDAQGLRPMIVGEFEDTALLKVFGQTGIGLFPAPTIVAKEIEERYSVRTVARIQAVTEQFYAISPERSVKHPAVLAITQAARDQLLHCKNS